MKKLLLFVSLFLAFQTQAQIFRLTYNTTTCPSPLNGAAAIYLYAGANISAPGNPPTHFTDAAFSNPGLYPLTQTGPGIWEICFNPFQVFKDGNGSTIPTSATIYSFDVQFRDAATTIFTGDCSGNAVRINDPMTSPSSSHPSISFGLVVPTCNVGLPVVNANILSITNSPNPLKSISTFSLNLPVKGHVKMEVFNILGKRVKTLLNEKDLAGHMDISWKGDGDNGSLLANGCYFYTLTVDDKAVKTNKIIISR